MLRDWVEYAAQDFAGFEILVGQELERQLEEGRFHRGRAVVTQFVARKPLTAATALTPTDSALPEVTGATRLSDEPLPLLTSAKGTLAAAVVSQTARTVRVSALSTPEPEPEPELMPEPEVGQQACLVPAAYKAAMDAVFTEAAAAIAGRSDAHVAADAAVALRRARAGCSDTDNDAAQDPLLACAPAALHIACSVSARAGAASQAAPTCRYCWLPQRPGTDGCICATLAAFVASTSQNLPMAGASTASNRSDMTAAAQAHHIQENTQHLLETVDAKLATGDRSLGSAPTRAPKRVTIHWVILIHPNEFLRRSSTVKLGPWLLSHGRDSNRDTCELLVYGAACHRTRIGEPLCCMHYI